MLLKAAEEYSIAEELLQRNYFFAEEQSFAICDSLCRCKTVHVD